MKTKENQIGKILNRLFMLLLLGVILFLVIGEMVMPRENPRDIVMVNLWQSKALKLIISPVWKLNLNMVSYLSAFLRTTLRSLFNFIFKLLKTAWMNAVPGCGFV